MKVVATEYIIGNEVVADDGTYLWGYDLLGGEVRLTKIDREVFYPTSQQPDKEEELNEEEFKGYPVEEVRCWEDGKIVKKHLIIVGEFAYDLQ